MKFFHDAPYIPDELIALQEKGDVVYICGAGVSKTIGLPTFRELVEHIYQELRETWDPHLAEREVMREGGELAGQYDRVLRSLERRLGASDLSRNQRMRERIRAVIRTRLAVPDDANFWNHLALLELSRNEEGRTRLLTTNFDTVFERAWRTTHQGSIGSHAGAAMPQPKVAGFEGVLHLHGRLADTGIDPALSETNLVLTSPEFGDAYLRSGWASRYVYDLVRACTVVLVGYEADDPPMRYLLEVLEADRERYPDLHKVYAFVPYAVGQEDLRLALWEAKGVEPIPYRTQDHDHSLLYRALREWRRYAQDPTAWRRGRLREILSQEPDAIEDPIMQECVALLRHGDASQILGELSPAAEWLSVLVEKGVFRKETVRVGEWIASRIADPGMIRACAGLGFIDEQSGWLIDRAMEREQQNLTPVRLRAWHLIIRDKGQPRPHGFDDRWFRAARRIKNGDITHDVRSVVGRLLCPRLVISKPVRCWRATEDEEQPETLGTLIDIDFKAAEHPSADDILKSWPENIEQEIALFRVLERELIDALEEATDVVFLDRWDRASRDVPSVARHAQNQYSSGFYRITRVLADLWQLIASKDGDVARFLVADWARSAYLLVRRLYLFVLCQSQVFSTQETLSVLMALDDGMFWASDAQVEIMRLLTVRWAELVAEGRANIEARIRQGVPRNLYPATAFEEEGEWESISDSSIFRRLKRIAATGGALSAESLKLLTEIVARHPEWEPNPGDRDDFSVWHESGYGPEGHPELLTNVPDNALVKEALRLQQERRFEEGDIWRVFCSADPDRALRGLGADAAAGEWNVDAWSTLLWSATERDQDAFQIALADALLQLPVQIVRRLLHPGTSWLQRRRTNLMAPDQNGRPRYCLLWDKLAAITYGADGVVDDDADRRDVLSDTLGHPGGLLAWTIVQALNETKPRANATLGPEFTPRFNHAVDGHGLAGLLARVHFSQVLAYLDYIDPEWTAQQLVPCFAWDHSDADALWQGRAMDRIGSARLFNSLKPAMLEAFERLDSPDSIFEGLVTQLLYVMLWKLQPEAAAYDLEGAEVKRALAAGPPDVRRHASHQLWRWMGEQEGLPANKPQRWEEVVGPVFRSMWPLDAKLREEGSSQNLVFMALACEDAFPDAVDAIIDFVVPYQLYLLAHSLLLEEEHHRFVQAFPKAFVRLVNALIDPAIYPAPGDLGEFLQKCARADVRITSDPSYVRLFGISRQVAA
jgi:hypothetical protein